MAPIFQFGPLRVYYGEVPADANKSYIKAAALGIAVFTVGVYCGRWINQQPAVPIVRRPLPPDGVADPHFGNPSSDNTQNKRKLSGAHSSLSSFDCMSDVTNEGSPTTQTVVNRARAGDAAESSSTKQPIKSSKSETNDEASTGDRTPPLYVSKKLRKSITGEGFKNPHLSDRENCPPSPSSSASIIEWEDSTSGSSSTNDTSDNCDDAADGDHLSDFSVSFPPSQNFRGGTGSP